LKFKIFQLLHLNIIIEEMKIIQLQII